MKDAIRHKRRCAVPLAAALLLMVPALAGAVGLEANPSSVSYLPVDEDARDRIDAMDKHLADRRWRQAIEICQKCIARPAQGVVKLRDGIYGSVRALCESKLEAAPPAARTLYRRLYDAEAGALYARAVRERDVEAARRLVSEFRLTSHGADGMDLLATLLFERGDLAEAADRWARWMDAAGPDAARPGVRRTAAKIAVAAAKLGKPRLLDRALQLFGAKGAAVDIGQATITSARQLRTLVQRLQRQRPPAARRAPGVADFMRWRTGLESQYAGRTRDYGSRARIPYTCYGDLVDGVLYINAAPGPRAFDALTGRRLWHRAARNYGSQPYQSLRSFGFHCRVYPAAGGAPNKLLFASGGARLGAFDADTGRPLWSKSRSSFARVGAIGNDPSLRVAFSSPVLYDGRRAYVVMETSRAEVHVMAFDPTSGKLRWRTGAGGSAPKSGYRISFPSALLSAGPDLVFCTGRGTIGRCSRATGEPRWLVPYRRRSDLITSNYYNLSIRLRHSPLVQVGDSILCLPADGQQLIALRIRSGEVRWQKELKDAKHLIGVLRARGDREPDRIFVAGKDVACLDGNTGAVLWRWPLPETESLGLGQVTDHGIALATARGLYVLDSASGELTRFVPLSLPSGDGINVTSDRDSLGLVFRSGAGAVGGKAQTRGLLAKRLAASPGDPWALGTEARLLRAEGNGEGALGRLTEALAGAKKGPAWKPLAQALQRERIGLCDELCRKDWHAGRRIAAFQRMLQALRAPERAPYECKLGFRASTARGPARPHRILMASGDSFSGRLVSIESGRLTVEVAGETWRIAAGGVRWVILTGGFRTAGRAAAPPGGYVLYTEAVDVISCPTLTLKGSVLRAPSRFGEMEVNLSQAAAIAVGGSAPAPPARRVFLKLRNGGRLSGVIRAFDGTEFILDIPSCGRRRIKADDIHTIGNRRDMPPPQPGQDRSGGIHYPLVMPKEGIKMDIRKW